MTVESGDYRWKQWWFSEVMVNIKSDNDCWKWGWFSVSFHPEKMIVRIGTLSLDRIPSEIHLLFSMEIRVISFDHFVIWMPILTAGVSIFSQWFVAFNSFLLLLIFFKIHQLRNLSGDHLRRSIRCHFFNVPPPPLHRLDISFELIPINYWETFWDVDQLLCECLMAFTKVDQLLWDYLRHRSEIELGDECG